MNLYQIIQKYGVYFKAAYNFSFMDEHFSTLTLLVQKHVLRNRIVDRHRKKIVVVTSINFERVSFFLEQIREYVALEWKGPSTSTNPPAGGTEYDCIFCFSSRIPQHFKRPEPAGDPPELLCEPGGHRPSPRPGLLTPKHRFLASSFVLELAGKSEREIVEYLKEQYGDYFV